MLPIILLVLGCAYLALKAVGWRRKRRLAKDGYVFDFVSPSVLRGNDNEYAFVYRTRDHEVWFVGIQDHTPLSPRFGDHSEKSQMFFEENRKLIMDRLRHEIQSRWTKARFRVEDEP